MDNSDSKRERRPDPNPSLSRPSDTGGQTFEKPSPDLVACWREEVEELQAALTRTESICASLRLDKKSLNDQILALEEKHSLKEETWRMERRELELKNSICQSKLVKIQSDYQEKTDELDACRREVSKYEKKIIPLQDAFIEKKAKVEHLEASCKVLNSEISEKIKLLQEAREGLRTSLDEIERLKTQLRQRDRMWETLVNEMKSVGDAKLMGLFSDGPTGDEEMDRTERELYGDPVKTVKVESPPKKASRRRDRDEESDQDRVVAEERSAVSASIDQIMWSTSERSRHESSSDAERMLVKREKSSRKERELSPYKKVRDDSPYRKVRQEIPYKKIKEESPYKVDLDVSYKKDRNDSPYDKVSDRSLYKKGRDENLYKKDRDEIPYKMDLDDVSYKKGRGGSSHKKLRGVSPNEADHSESRYKKDFDDSPYEKDPDDRSYKKSRNENLYKKDRDEISYKKSHNEESRKTDRDEVSYRKDRGDGSHKKVRDESPYEKDRDKFAKEKDRSDTSHKKVRDESPYKKSRDCKQVRDEISHKKDRDDSSHRKGRDGKVAKLEKTSSEDKISESDSRRSRSRSVRSPSPTRKSSSRKSKKASKHGEKRSKSSRMSRSRSPSRSQSRSPRPRKRSKSSVSRSRSRSSSRKVKECRLSRRRSPTRSSSRSDTETRSKRRRSRSRSPSPVKHKRRKSRSRTRSSERGKKRHSKTNSRSRSRSRIESSFKKTSSNDVQKSRSKSPKGGIRKRRISVSPEPDVLKMDQEPIAKDRIQPKFRSTEFKQRVANLIATSDVLEVRTVRREVKKTSDVVEEASSDDSIDASLNETKQRVARYRAALESTDAATKLQTLAPKPKKEYKDPKERIQDLLRKAQAKLTGEKVEESEEMECPTESEEKTGEVAVQDMELSDEGSSVSEIEATCQPNPDQEQPEPAKETHDKTEIENPPSPSEPITEFIQKDEPEEETPDEPEPPEPPPPMEDILLPPEPPGPQPASKKKDHAVSSSISKPPVPNKHLVEAMKQKAAKALELNPAEDKKALEWQRRAQQWTSWNGQQWNQWNQSSAAAWYNWYGGGGYQNQWNHDPRYQGYYGDQSSADYYGQYPPYGYESGRTAATPGAEAAADEKAENVVESETEKAETVLPMTTTTDFGDAEVADISSDPEPAPPGAEEVSEIEAT